MKRTICSVPFVLTLFVLSLLSFSCQKKAAINTSELMNQLAGTWSVTQRAVTDVSVNVTPESQKDPNFKPDGYLTYDIISTFTFTASGDYIVENKNEFRKFEVIKSDTTITEELLISYVNQDVIINGTFKTNGEVLKFDAESVRINGEDEEIIMSYDEYYAKNPQVGAKSLLVEYYITEDELVFNADDEAESKHFKKQK